MMEGLAVAKRPPQPSKAGAGASAQDPAVLAILRRVRKAERKLGDGTDISGTGFTILKFQDTTIQRLVASERIKGPEISAINEIDRVYSYICSGLFCRSMSYSERLDKGTRATDPAWFIDAYHGRYLPWAQRWSTRKKAKGDITLQIVFDVLFSDSSGKDIDREQRWRNGSAIDLFVCGIRDYAALAGWVDRTTASRWQDTARTAFGLLRMRAPGRLFR